MGMATACAWCWWDHLGRDVGGLGRGYRVGWVVLCGVALGEEPPVQGVLGWGSAAYCGVYVGS